VPSAPDEPHPPSTPNIKTKSPRFIVTSSSVLPNKPSIRVRSSAVLDARVLQARNGRTNPAEICDAFDGHAGLDRVIHAPRAASLLAAVFVFLASYLDAELIALRIDVDRADRRAPRGPLRALPAARAAICAHVLRIPCRHLVRLTRSDGRRLYLRPRVLRRTSRRLRRARSASKEKYERNRSLHDEQDFVADPPPVKLRF